MSRMSDFIISVVETNANGKTIDELVNYIRKAYGYQIDREYVEQIIKNHSQILEG